MANPQLGSLGKGTPSIPSDHHTTTSNCAPALATSHPPTRRRRPETNPRRIWAGAQIHGRPPPLVAKTSASSSARKTTKGEATATAHPGAPPRLPRAGGLHRCSPSNLKGALCREPPTPSALGFGPAATAVHASGSGGRGAAGRLVCGGARVSPRCRPGGRHGAVFNIGLSKP